MKRNFSKFYLKLITFHRSEGEEGLILNGFSKKVSGSIPGFETVMKTMTSSGAGSGAGAVSGGFQTVTRTTTSGGSGSVSGGSATIERVQVGNFLEGWVRLFELDHFSF